MKRLKSILSFVLALCLLLSTATVAFADTAVPASDEYNVIIEANGVMFRIAEGEQIGTGEGGTVGGSASRTVSKGQTLTDAEVYVWHEEADTPYLLGWERHVLKYDANGNEVWDKYTDEEGTLILLTTEEMLSEPIYGETRFIPVWKGKYTTDTHIELHGNGGTYTHAFKNWEYVAICEMGIDSYSSFTETANLTGMGVSDLTDPVHPDGKMFEGWMVYYHGPTEMEYTEPSNGGKLYTSEEIMKYNGTKTGYNLFIAKWAEEDIDPNNAIASDVNNLLGTEPLRQVTIESPGVPFMNHIAAGMTSEGERFSTKVRHCSTLYDSGIEIWHFSENEDKFLGWQPIRIEDGVETVQDYLLSNEELLVETIDADYRFVAQWEGGSDEPIVPDEPTVPDQDEYFVNIESGSVSFHFEAPIEDDPDNFDSFEAYGGTGMTVAKGQTLADNRITVWYDDEHEPYHLGWIRHSCLIDSHGNEYWEPDTDSDGNLIFYTTEEILNIPINTNTTFSAQWEGKYTNLVWLTLHGNGGSFERTHMDYSNTEVRRNGYTSVFNMQPNTSLFTNGDRNINDPVHPDGKTFEGWAVYYHGPTGNSFGAPSLDRLLTSEEVLYYDDTLVGYTDFIAKWEGEEIDPNNVSIYEFDETVSSVPTRIAVIVPGDAWVNYTIPGESGEFADPREFFVVDGTSLADNKTEIRLSDEDEARLVGWHVYKLTEDGEVYDGLISTEEMLALPLDSNCAFYAEFTGNEGPDIGTDTEPSSGVEITLESNYGSFSFKHGDNTKEVTHRTPFSIYIEPLEGMTPGSLGVSDITDIKYWDGKRKFAGWNVFEVVVMSPENSDEWWYEEILITDEPISTEDMLNYNITSYRTIFRAAWEGDDADYTTFIEFNACSGNIPVQWNPDDPDSIEEHTTFGDVYMQNGQSVSEQIQWLLFDPVREGYTFEGWLAIDNTEPRYSISTKLYTTDEVMKLPVPANETVYLAKWEEIPIEDYLYRSDYPGSEEYIALLHGGGGTVRILLDYGDDSDEELTLPAVPTYLGQKVSFNDILEMEPDLKKIEIVPSRPDYTFTGWSIYTADRLYVLSAPQNTDIPADGFTVENMYDLNGESTFAIYKNKKLVKENVTTEELMAYSSEKNIIYVANWASAEPVKITKQPKTTYTQLGEKAKFTVKAEGEGLTYQWYYKDVDGSKYKKCSGTKATYSLEMTEARKDRKLYCVITDEHGNEVKSNTVTMKMAASIKTEPKTTYTELGEKAKFTVKAVGDGLTYQWYYKDTDGSKYKKCSGTKATYSLEMTEARKDRKLYCIITDKYGNEVKSKTVTMKMAASVKTQPKTSYTQLDEKAKFTVKAVGDGLTYQWYYKSAGSSKYKKASCTKATYTITMTEDRKDRKFYCIITDKYGNEVKSKTVTMKMAASIETEPKSVKTSIGKKAKFTVKAVGDGLTYQWYYKDTDGKKYKKASCTKATYSIELTKARNGRKFYCVVTDKYGNTVKTKTVSMKKK